MRKVKNLCGDQQSTDEKKVLCFGLLGAFSYGEKGSSAQSETLLKAGKKAVSFLQYMIINHERCVSSEELIGKFWTEKSRAPENALRNMLFKVRNLLKEMFPEQEETIVTLPGGYAWSHRVRLELDTEQFEGACLKAREEQGDTYLKLLLRAVSLYRGDLLPANDGDWLFMLRQYYRTLYLDVCRTVLPILYKKEQWIELIGICEQAYRIDFTVEDFTTYQMRALIGLGQFEKALEIYEVYGTKLEEELGLFPGEQVEEIRTLALGMTKKELQMSDILKLTCKEEEDQHAFFCTFEMFQNIVTLERRHLTRSGEDAALVIISLGKGAVPTTDARRLERVLMEGLRGGDPVARLEAGSYVLMLPGADEENAWAVMGRIDSSFHRIYRHSKARLTYCISKL